MGHTILFIDDDDDWCLLVGNLLRDAGFQARTAHTATEAILQMGRSKPELIILDANLHGQDGAIIRQFLSFTNPKVPIILYTGLAEEDQTVQIMLSMGHCRYLHKGPLDELLLAVQKALNQPWP